MGIPAQTWWRAAVVALVLAAAATPAPGLGDEPGGPVLVIADPHSGLTLVLDRATMLNLPPVTFRTSTIWTEGVSEFKGVSLARLLDLAEVESGMVRATAANAYSVEIPIADVTADAPIVAYEIDGKPMSMRNKGPYWVVYPYDADPAYRTEVTYSRSIWQLTRIDILR